MPITLTTPNGKVELPDSLLCSRCPRPTRIWPAEAMEGHQAWHRQREQKARSWIFGGSLTRKDHISKGHRKHRPTGKELKDEGINIDWVNRALGGE